MSEPEKKPFFVGYLPAPPELRTFLIVTIVSFIVIFGATGLIIGATQDDPGPGAGYGRQTVTGIVEMLPYPVVHVTEGSDRLAVGRTVLLSSAGKNGAVGRAEPLAGQAAQVSGLLLNRGEMDMIQLRGGQNGMQAAEGTGTLPEPEPLGRWRLAGEICDGKCYAGIMRPGRGLAHRACADLCISGQIPPVFVSTQPVEGSEFLLVTGPDGGFLPQEGYDAIAEYISVEGEITRHGDLLVFAMDPATIEVLP
ncbi:MAG: hypothetical protein AAFQ66_15070 [Pseudomonadota bacterium]